MSRKSKDKTENEEASSDRLSRLEKRIQMLEEDSNDTGDMLHELRSENEALLERIVVLESRVLAKNMDHEGVEYDSTKWLVGSVVRSIVQHKIDLVNTRDSKKTNSRKGEDGNNHVNKKATDPMLKELVDFKGAFSLCLHCFNAGKEPSKCIFANSRAVFLHRAGGECSNPVEHDVAGRKKPPQTPQNHIEGQD